MFSIAAVEFVKHGNLYFESSYNGELKINGIKVIPQRKIRRGKSDDLGFTGKYQFDNHEFLSSKKTTQPIHIYNSKKAVIEAQIASTGSILDWNGQIMHIKQDYASNYSLPMCYSVMQDMLAEQNSSLYRANNIIKGFTDNNIISTPRLADEEANSVFVRQFKAMQGAAGAGQDLLIQPATGTEDLDKVLKILPLTKAAKSDKFIYADSKAEQSIAKAYKIPQILINPSDSGLFGNSGELLNSAKKFLFETYKDERNLILGKLNQLLSNWHEGAVKVNVINPFEEAPEEEEVEEIAEDVNATAQANLRGSVGGVTGILAIQTGVSTGTTTRKSGIAVLVNIYGFTEELAAEMLGEPKKEEDNA